MDIRAVKMTQNEKKVYVYLRMKCWPQFVVKCAATEISLKFNWSEQYVKILLKRMCDKDFLEVLVGSEGRRAKKYRLTKIALGSIVVRHKKKKLRTKDLESTLGATVLKSQRHLGATVWGNSSVNSIQNGPKKLLRYFNNINNRDNNNIETTRNALTSAHPDRGRVMALVKHIKLDPKPDRRAGSLFRNFRKKLDNPSVWNAQDIVCYYILLFKAVHGSFPVVNKWRIEFGAARNLLNYFDGSGEQVKRVLQLCFQLTPDEESPTSLAWFTQAWVLNKVIQRQDHEITMWELEDDVVYANLS